MFKRIDHVEIVTDQLHRTVQFYTEVLGFTVKARDRIESSGLGVPMDARVLFTGYLPDYAYDLGPPIRACPSRNFASSPRSTTRRRRPMPIPTSQREFARESRPLVDATEALAQGPPRLNQRREHF